MIIAMTNEEKLLILEAARAIGFEYGEEGKLVCTLDQLAQLCAGVAEATALQIIEAVKNER